MNEIGDAVNPPKVYKNWVELRDDMVKGLVSLAKAHDNRNIDLSTGKRKNKRHRVPFLDWYKAKIVEWTDELVDSYTLVQCCETIKNLEAGVWEDVYCNNIFNLTSWILYSGLSEMQTRDFWEGYNNTLSALTKEEKQGWLDTEPADLDEFDEEVV